VNRREREREANETKRKAKQTREKRRRQNKTRKNRETGRRTKNRLTGGLGNREKRDTESVLTISSPSSTPRNPDKRRTPISFVQTSLTIDHHLHLPIISQETVQEVRTKEDAEQHKQRRKQQQSGKPLSPWTSFSPSPRSCTTLNSSFPPLCY